MRSIPFEKISNVRDLGGIPVAGGRVVKRGLLFRGAALHSATPADCAKLRDELGVRHVIDLRIGYEVEAEPDVVPDGALYRRIPFYDNEAIGYEYFDPIPGTIVIGKDFACDPDHFYADMANPLTAGQLRILMHALIDAAMAGEPVLFHCSGGKDRAGITALLVLELLGASEQAILDDYLVTNEARQAGIDKIYQRFLRLCQGDEEFARAVTENHCARPQNLAAFRASVDQRYGSMDAFIRDVLQFDDGELAALRAALTEPA
ncbi:MAG: tyrosine-protein phosphatase [Coriobacteriia bacterium]|nr:tyrosine-protein phosphatase [Coriobacteriia bacterium]